MEGIIPMNVVNFFVNNWDTVLFIIVILIAVIFAAKKGETTVLKQICFSLVTKAEQEFGTGVGVLKYAVVADMLYQRIPSILKLFFSSKDIEKMVETTLAEAKDKWKDNNKLQEYIDKPQTLVADIQSTVTTISEEAIKTAVENGTTAAINAAKDALAPVLDKSE